MKLFENIKNFVMYPYQYFAPNIKQGIDLLSIVYDFNNTEHEQLLTDKINAFSKNYDLLTKIDLKISIPISVTLLLRMSGVYGTGICAILLAASSIYNYTSGDFKARNELSSQHKQDLHELLSLYQKAINDHGKQKILHDKTFMNLVKAISPFVAIDELINWQIPQTNQQIYSNEFLDIIEKENPQHIPKTLFKQKINLENETISHNSFYNTPEIIKNTLHTGLMLFNQAKSTLTYNLYGHNHANNEKKLSK